MRMTWLVTKRVSKFILRDKRLIALMLIVPVVMSLVIGYGFSGAIKNVDVVIVNLDNPTLIPLSATNNLTNYLKTQTDLVSVTEISFPTLQDWNESKQAVLDGEYKGAILFPEDFTDTLIGRLMNISNDHTSIEVYLDNSNPQISGNIIKALSEGFQFAFGSNMGLSITTEFAFDEGLTQLQYMMPSILPFAVFFMSFILSIISLINERKAGTLDLLLLSPYRKVNIILGYLIPLSAVSIIQATILIILTIFAFNVPILGGAGAYFAIYFMLLLCGMSGMVLGFFLSTFAKTELQAIQFIPMITFTMLLLAGILVPLESLPRWLLPISYMIPLTHGAEYLRTVMIEGTGFLWHWQIAPVVAFIVIMLLLSSLTLREKKI
ncbi:MAG: ABC transporter permease [Candidatus Heimdallarchaeota archaeon]|nr:MAG: ABC transporter permease [Candidatus Heimdallarchaeota archaeon]